MDVERQTKGRSRSNRDLVDECDNFPYYSDGTEAYRKKAAEYFEFRFEGVDACLGFMPSEIALRMPLTGEWTLDDVQKRLIFQPMLITGTAGDNADKRTELLARYLAQVRDQKVFGVLDGWRDELYPVYGPQRQLLFSMERSASPLFGIVTYGVHMTAYVKKTDGSLSIWTPRRSPTKQTYPNMMDNTVAGGLSTGEDPFECLIREAQEEASLPESVVGKARACGTLTYFHIRDARAGGETELCQPECQYIYDLELPNDVVPKPNDKEAVDFRLLSVDEVQTAMRNGEFKPNCAFLLLEFFVRHGIVNAENEPDYIEIVSRLHRKLEFPTR